MKIYLTLPGSFHRTPINRTPLPRISLEEWLKSLQSTAVKVKQRSPQLLRQRFGIDFLPERTLINLLQQANQIEHPQELYELPELKLLRSVEVLVSELLPILYHYQFIASEAQIELRPDDPQIPQQWQLGEISQSGTYQLAIEKSDFPGLSEDFVHSLWRQARQYWQALPQLEQIHRALQSPNPYHFGFSLPENSGVEVWIESEDLDVQVKETIAHFQYHLQGNSPRCSASVQTLIQQYEDAYTLSTSHLILSDGLHRESALSSHQRFIIGRRKSRNAIEALVAQAQRFLLVSSYVIEDIFLTELICQKATTLPQGVWILTDLRDEVVDRIDNSVKEDANLPEAYQRANQRKIECLSMLLDAGARIRGGPFHLKTYISERGAYLGSCNLTGGSLDFNLEAGLICHNTITHQDLIQYFIHCWQYQSHDDILPSRSAGQFIQRSLRIPPPNAEFRSTTLLTLSQYRIDLLSQLRQFTKQVDIYSRSFTPDAEILSLLRPRLTQVYVNSVPERLGTGLLPRLVSDMHAKITLLGDRVAYIGGINFNFGLQLPKLVDLMYKTSNRQEIIQIRQQLVASHL